MSDTYKVTKRLFSISTELLEQFVKLEKRFVTIGMHDFYMIYPGMGSACYMSADGRLAWDNDDMWETPWRLGEAYAAIRAASIRRDADFSFLASLLPLNLHGDDCSYCKVSGACLLGDGKIVCPMCHGLGWTLQSLKLDVNVVYETVIVHGPDGEVYK